MAISLRLSREPLLTTSDLELIERSASEIVAEVGISVADDALRGQLVAAGFAERDGRVLIEPSVFIEFLNCAMVGFQ